MARVTVEDCIEKVPNRFKLVLLAAYRARKISDGSLITVPEENDKKPVISLREIAAGTLSAADLEDELIHSLQRHVEVDEPEFDRPETPALAEGVFRDSEDRPDSDVTFSALSEEELSAGLARLVPPEKSEGDY